MKPPTMNILSWKSRKSVNMKPPGRDILNNYPDNDTTAEADAQACEDADPVLSFLRWPIAAVCLFLCPGFFVAALQGFAFILDDYDIRGPFTFGLLVGLVLCLILRSAWPCYVIFLHELGHATMAIIFQREIEVFHVCSSCGYVQHVGNFGGQIGDHLITLAPYWLPLFTIVSLPCYIFIPEEYRPWYYVWIGACVSHRFVSTITETSRDALGSHSVDVNSPSATSDYSDMRKAGRIISTLAIMTYYFFTISIIFFLLTQVHDGGRIWCNTVIQTGMNLYGSILEGLAELIR